MIFEHLVLLLDFLYMMVVLGLILWSCSSQNDVFFNNNFLNQWWHPENIEAFKSLENDENTDICVLFDEQSQIIISDPDVLDVYSWSYSTNDSNKLKIKDIGTLELLFFNEDGSWSFSITYSLFVHEEGVFVVC